MDSDHFSTPEKERKSIISPRSEHLSDVDEDESGKSLRKKVPAKKTSSPKSNARKSEVGSSPPALDAGFRSQLQIHISPLELAQQEKKLQAEIEARRKALTDANLWQNQRFAKLQDDRQKELNQIRKKNIAQLSKCWAEAGQETEAQRIKVEVSLVELRAQDAKAVKKLSDNASQAQAEAEDLRLQLLAERELQKQIREDCEWRMQEMHLEMSMEVAQVRRTAAASAESALAEARRLVDTVTARFDGQKRRLMATSRDSISSVEMLVAEKASQVRVSVRRVVEEYWRRVAQAYQDIEKETRSLQQLCAELEESTMSDREALQARARRNAESKIQAHKTRKRALLAQIEALQQQHDAAVAEVMQKLESDCRKFENACRRRACLQISLHRRAAQSRGHQSTIDRLARARPQTMISGAGGAGQSAGASQRVEEDLEPRAEEQFEPRAEDTEA